MNEPSEFSIEAVYCESCHEYRIEGEFDILDYQQEVALIRCGVCGEEFPVHQEDGGDEEEPFRGRD